AVRRAAKPWRKHRAAWRLRKDSGMARKRSRITSKSVDRHPYRGNPRGRVKCEDANSRGLLLRPPGETAASSRMTALESFASLSHKKNCPGRTGVHKGRVIFGAMDEVVFGEPAAEAVAAQMDRLNKSCAFLMVSGTLRRQTDAIAKIEHARGSRCAAIFDTMPQHTPREAVIAAAGQARAAKADLIVTVGGGSITDGAKAVQLCLANDIRDVAGMDAIRAAKGAPPPMNAPN